MALVSFADNVVKNLTGQYTFRSATHRATSSARLRVGGATVLDPNGVDFVTIPPDGTLTIDASVSCSIGASVDASASWTLHLANMVDGQIVRLTLLYGGTYGTVTFDNSTGIFTSNTGQVDVFMFIKIGATIYFVQRTVA